jgi:hypothetical protein
MMTGQPAFAGATTAVIFEAILNRSIRPLREAVPDTPPDFAALHLSLLGHSDEAITLGRRSVELDPLMPFWNAMLTQAYLFSRRYAETIGQADITLVSSLLIGWRTCVAVWRSSGSDT